MSRCHGHYSDSANGPTYGQQLDAEQIQSLVDQRIKVLLGGAGSQHLDSCPQRPCLQAMLPTGMPTYGSQMPEAERILSLIDQRIKDHLGAAGSQQAVIPDATVKLNCNTTSRGGGGGDSMSFGGGGDSMVKNTTSCETPRSYSNFTAGGKEEALYTELWHACAGPLVTVPREGERVFYFPQGHIEQQDEHAVEKEPLPPAPRMPHSHSIPVEQDETLKFREDSPGITSSPSDHRRRLWPVPLRKFTQNPLA